MNVWRKLGQNLRTRISTIVAFGAYMYLVISQFDPSAFSDDPTIMKFHRIFSMICAGCAWLNSHYFNQDYSPEMDAHTKLGREEKKRRLQEQPIAEEPEDSYIEEEVIADEI